MPQSQLKLKSNVTRRDAAAANPDLKTRPAELQQTAEVTAEPSKRDPEPSGKQIKREANALQFSFLTVNLNRVVTVFTINGIRLVGRLRQFDQYCILLEGPDGLNSLIFKHAVSTMTPAANP